MKAAVLAFRDCFQEAFIKTPDAIVILNSYHDPCAWYVGKLVLTAIDERVIKSARTCSRFSKLYFGIRGSIPRSSSFGCYSKVGAVHFIVFKAGARLTYCKCPVERCKRASWRSVAVCYDVQGSKRALTFIKATLISMSRLHISFSQ